RRVGGFEPGERVNVGAVENDRVYVDDARAKGRRELPLGSAQSFSVYERHELTLTTGDRLRVTKKNVVLGGTIETPQGYRLNEGEVQEVKTVRPDGWIEVKSGAALRPDSGHFTHGYVATPQEARNQTAQHVLIADDARLDPARRARFYAEVRPGLEATTIYTKDKRELKEAVRLSSGSQQTHELNETVARHLEQAHHLR